MHTKYHFEWQFLLLYACVCALFHSSIFYGFFICIITYRVIAVLSRQNTNKKNEWLKNSWEFFDVCGWRWWKSVGRRNIICLSKKSWRYSLNIYVFKQCVLHFEMNLCQIYIHHYSCVVDWYSFHQSALTVDVASATAATLIQTLSVNRIIFFLFHFYHVFIQ